VKPAILIAAAFVLSLGGSTTVLVLRAGPPVPPDSAAVETAHPDSAAASSAAPDTAQAAATDSSAAGPPADSAPATDTARVGAPRPATAAPATDTARVGTARPATAARATDTARVGAPRPATAAPAAPVAAARPTPAPPAGRPTAAEAAAARDVVYRQLSRIYSAMKPSEAAEVLSHLGEEDVIGILSKFGARQAAQILGAMPRERAAALSQRLLLGSGAPQGSQ